MIEIKVEDGEVRGLLNRLSGRMQNLSPVMRAISGIMHDAVEENFEREGRPKWKKLAKSTEEQRAKKGKWPGKILQLSQGGLAAANTQGYNNHSAWVSNNKEYAAAQQFGTRPFIIRPKNKPYLRFQIGDKWVTKKEIHHPGIPARPFMKLTPGDLEKIKQKIGSYLVDGNV
ncbi:phage virion morphogenesis protein [Candidatus Brocadia sapporoensis]|uniref:Phage virion morphogenesis protein n=1 Tax=Candidatus Brocadia sapporoensis TaxID=392547 RepID=A0A1V6M146_9BACT|nr:phage virion morphogenesis protein [Candidatus Brocadia sapporoensis]MDG6005542.1 phage virion morphogenesis protein [Candidatus Brocadia sp.]OQD46131.1 phage virion morphogenesis protein [Candidatus Brocadia sapporoensis]GJQ23582.1 MAG: Mu-like prophage FluMu G protein 2 [Candidatus Brocadia sapporoensis]